jgi:shikimate dehydrogenase
LTARYAVIGEPVAHSLSPAMFNAAFAAREIDATYAAIEVRADEAQEFAERARRGAFAGFNVTTPLKETIAALVDELSDDARAANAVNVVRSDGEALTGHNTDGAGLVRALADLWGWKPQGASVLLLGSGPAARAIATTLKEGGAAHVACWSRNDATAQRIGPPPRRPADLVVSTLPASAVVPDAVLEFVGPSSFVFDANYDAARSPVPPGLGRARSAGLPMLLHQGALSYEWWFGAAAPLDVMRAALGLAGP